MLENRRFFCLWESGDLEGAAVAIDRAVREIPAADAPEARIGLLVVLANARHHQARYDEAEAAAREAHVEAERIGDTRAAADARAAWGFALCFRGSVEAGIQHLREAMAVLARSNGDQAWLATSNLASGLVFAGRHGEAIDMLYERYEELRRDETERRWGPMIVSNLVDSLTALGRWGEADRLLAGAALPDHDTLESAWLQQSAAELDVLRGDVDSARSRMEAAERVVGIGPGLRQARPTLHAPLDHGDRPRRGSTDGCPAGHRGRDRPVARP